MRLAEREDKLARDVIYPLGEYYAAPAGEQVGAVMTGEFRPVRRWEWYFSGASITAYRAPRGTTSPYYIARVVTFRTETEVRIIDLNFKGGENVKG